MTTMTMNDDRLSVPVLASELVAEPFAGRPLTTECPHCGKKLLTMAGLWEQCDDESPLRKLVEGLERVCNCEAAQRAAEEEKRAQRAAEELERKIQEQTNLEHLWQKSGMPRSWQERGLASWVREKAARRTAYEVTVEFGRQLLAGNKPQGLFIAGDIGTGKTFLASCLCVNLLKKNRQVLWCNVSEVLRALRATFNNSRLSEEEVLRSYTAPAILVLDDLGKERPTEWAVEQLFSIINARYDKRKPVIVTTNYGGEDLVRRLTPRPDADGYADDTTARAIVDRLREMCYSVTLTGESWRKGIDN